jgi:uncharacterized membrane protein YccC
VLVPAGALSSQSWHQPVFVALGAIFIALLHPSNPAIYDPGQFYNSAIALLAGISFAMLAIRLLPPMSPATRVRRLLALTLRDLRRLTSGKLPRSSVGWERRICGRLSAIPDSVDTLQAARLTAALSIGSVSSTASIGRWRGCQPGNRVRGCGRARAARSAPSPTRLCGTPAISTRRCGHELHGD